MAEKIKRNERGKCSNEIMEVSGHRTIQKLSWSDVARRDMKAKGVHREKAQDRRKRQQKRDASTPSGPFKCYVTP